MIRTLCVDLMDTVIADPYREALRAATGMEPAQLRGLRDPDCWPALEVGAIDDAEFARRFFRDPARHFDLEAFHRARRSGYRWVPGMRALLKRVGGRLERYLASNYPVWIDELSRDLGLEAVVDGVVASCHVGVRKPDPAFFEHMLDRVGRPPGECLFVDDRPENCEAAERAGLLGHPFVGAADLAARLRSEGALTDSEACGLAPVRTGGGRGGR